MKRGCELEWSWATGLDKALVVPRSSGVAPWRKVLVWFRQPWVPLIFCPRSRCMQHPSVWWTSEGSLTTGVEQAPTGCSVPVEPGLIRCVATRCDEPSPSLATPSGSSTGTVGAVKSFLSRYKSRGFNRAGGPSLTGTESPEWVVPRNCMQSPQLFTSILASGCTVRHWTRTLHLVLRIFFASAD